MSKNMIIKDYFYISCASILNEPLLLKCLSYLPEQIDLGHTHICAMSVDQHQRHPITLFIGYFVSLDTYRHDVKHCHLVF